MPVVRHAKDRGVADFGWLQSQHTFSFGNYLDRNWMGFGPLRVINEDRVAPGRGFGEHSHRDMEILSWVLEGALEHKDSLGTGAVIRPGELQRMSAGTGVTHSEFNASPNQSVHFLQIWVMPRRDSLPPAYEQRTFEDSELRNRWCRIASGTPRDDAVVVNQDVDLFAARLDTGHTLTYFAAPKRRLWLQVAKGEIALDDATLVAGDGAAWWPAQDLALRATSDAEVLLFDMTP